MPTSGNPYGYGTVNWDNPPMGTASGSTATGSSNYDNNSIIGNFINTAGASLQPITPYTTSAPYEQFAKPQREVFNQWEANTFRPTYERFTLNPFKRQQANTFAAGNAGMMGGGANIYRDRFLQNMQTGYFDPLQQAQNQWSEMIRKAYEQQMTNAANSPTTGVGG